DDIRDFHVTGVQTCALPIYTNNADFIISNDSLLTSIPLSYDVKTTRSIRILSSDGLCTYEKIFGITIKDTNSTPSLIALSQDTVAENNLPQDIVGQLVTVDFDS